MKKIILLILSFIITAQYLSAQNINKAKLDSLLDALESSNKGMGSVAIRKNGTLLYSRAIGCSNCDVTPVLKANENTVYRIGSITKTFTSVMIFQLIEEGKLTLDTKLETYFPKLTNAKLIRISDLLNHRSGLHDFTADKDYLTWAGTNKTQTQMLEIIAKGPSDFAPDSKAEYSNSNYVVLGFILEKVTGKPYSELLKTRITDKIGLKNTYVGSKMKPAEAYSYSYVNGWKTETITDMSIPHGAGAIVSTASDLTAFMDALFNLKLIKTESLEKMKTIKDGYGMGLFEFPFENRKAYGHNGGIDGFTSIAGYFPDDKLGVSYITNGQVYPINDIMIGILSIIYETPYQIPSFKSVAITSEELDKYLGNYSAAQVPIKILIAKNNNTLMAQATGQASFPLEAKGNHTFSFDQAGIILVFNPDKSEMTLRQGGGEFVFTREK